MTNLLIILTIVGWAIGSIFYKVASINNTVLLATISASYAVLTIFSFFVFKGEYVFTTLGVLYAILGSVSMSFATYAFMHLLHRGGAGEMTAIVSIYPALTVLISYVFLHEVMTPRKMIGCGLALVSVYLLGH